jgi:hypothetical protein
VLILASARSGNDQGVSPEETEIPFAGSEMANKTGESIPQNKSRLIQKVHLAISVAFVNGK